MGRNVEVGWHGQKRSNDTHESTNRSEARLYRKFNNTAATLCNAGASVDGEPQRVVVDAELTPATGYAERDTALDMRARLPLTTRRRTVAADKGYEAELLMARIGFGHRAWPHAQTPRMLTWRSSSIRCANALSNASG